MSAASPVEHPEVSGGQGPLLDEAPVPVGVVEAAALQFLRSLATGLSPAELEEAAGRAASTYRDLLSPEPFDFTTFPNDAGYDGLVIARGIKFVSVCRDHLLPLRGVAHIAYLPGERIVGLSKLARVVDHFARSLQRQEDLTRQIAEWLRDEIVPGGVGVVLEAEHECEMVGGGDGATTKTVTLAMHGVLREESPSRREFLAAIGSGS